ncbi:MAG: WG repeat-containing protein [Bacteroidales bacterium]
MESNIEKIEYSESYIINDNIEILRKNGIGQLITSYSLNKTSLLLIPIISNGKIGFINKSAEVVIKPTYDNILGSFKELSSIVCVEYEGKRGGINIKGDVVIPIDYKEFYPFQDGLALVRDFNYQYGYINLKNEIIIPIGKYYWCESFVNGLARVIGIKNNQKVWGIIDTNGCEVLELMYNKIYSFTFSQDITKGIINNKKKFIDLTLLKVTY